MMPTIQKRWVGCDAANFRPGRPAGQRPEMIVMHATRATMADITRLFFASDSARSAHYVVARDGSITQHVHETDTAFHAGLTINPSAPLVKARAAVNPNFYSIGIEHEGRTNGEWPTTQVQASAALIAEIAARWRIPVDTTHVVAHDAIRASADCPGRGFDVSRLLTLATTVVGETTLEAPQQLVLTARANIRRSPERSGDLLTVAPAGSTFNAIAIARGEPVAENDYWYVDAEGRYVWAGATDHPMPVQTDDPVSTDEMEHALPVAPQVAPPAPLALAVNRTLTLDTKDYVAVATTKNLIVLHFTAGQSARSAYDTWRGDPRRIATAYIVDRDGTIYETFDPRYWASHLGITGGPVHDKRSIGIEIANVGPLTLSPDRKALNWWVGQRFCAIEDEDQYRKRSYRGFDYYAAFPEVQVSAVAALAQHVTERFGIAKTFAPESRRLEFDATFFASFKGIATHANFRSDKFDIGPAFDWNALS